MCQFLTCSTFFESNGLILRNTVVNAVFVCYVYMYGGKKSSRWKSVAIVFVIEHTLPPASFNTHTCKHNMQKLRLQLTS